LKEKVIKAEDRHENRKLLIARVPPNILEAGSDG
jgi:hypothetical protein